MAKTLLTIEYDFDFALMGISCHEKDYKLCWHLNRLLGIQLAKEKDHEGMAQAEGSTLVSHYLYEDELNRATYRVLANRGEGGYLIQSYKQMDYFLIIDGAAAEKKQQWAAKQLQQSQVILATFMLDPNEIKDNQNLLFE